MRVVRLANFVMPRSGGLRTALRCLGEGYAAAGHEPVLVVPGERAGDGRAPYGRVITLPGATVPGTGGYRVLLGRRRPPGPGPSGSAGRPPSPRSWTYTAWKPTTWPRTS